MNTTLSAYAITYRPYVHGNWNISWGNVDEHPYAESYEIVVDETRRVVIADWFEGDNPVQQGWEVSNFIKVDGEWELTDYHYTGAEDQEKLIAALCLFSGADIETVMEKLEND